MDIFNYILERFSIPHLNILFLLGLALFGGTVGGRLFQKIRIPQVVGYIAIGIFLGETGLKIVDHDTILSLQPFSYFALGLIGFTIGGELKKEVLIKYGKQFLCILFCEGITAFLAVAASITFLGIWLFGDWKLSLSLGLLLGAIASATAPAATTQVLKEYKTRGPLTRTILGIVALDDGLALVLFAIATSIVGSLRGQFQSGLLRIFIHPFYEIGGAICIGIAAGFLLRKLLRRYSEEERLLAFSVGTVLFLCGVALAIHVDMLLAAMTLGVVIINFTPRKSRDVFKLLEGFTPPIYVLFFVLVGAKLNMSNLSPAIVWIGIVYLLARSFGKAMGSYVGARVSKAASSVQKYLPICLFSQAGVAIGLSILASHYFPGFIGNTVVVIVTATVFVLEIIGPALVKVAVTKAGEVGLNITEEDLIGQMAADDVMDKNPPFIFKDMPLQKILEIFRSSSNFYYPVVDTDHKLLGIITVDHIRNIFMEEGLTDLLLAVDLMQPSVKSVKKSTTLELVRRLMSKYNLECLPVVDSHNMVNGFIERRIFQKVISTKILEMQKKVDLLD